MQNFLSYAFRPFFLLNGIFAVGVIGVWMFVLHGGGPRTLPANVVYWHGHEMLVGFAMAAISGFMLTAVATWTGRPAVRGLPLAVLVCAWLTGRLAMGLAGVLPSVWVAVLDMLFPLLLIVLVAREVVGGGNERNYPIVFITVLLAAFNLLYHLSVLGVLDLSLNADRVALYLMIHLVLLLVTVIAGRIVPNFTANWLRSRGVEKLPRCTELVDRSTVLLTVATGLFAAVMPLSPATGVLALAAAAAHALRLSRWCGLATRSEPLLFVLHAAYAWFPIGYLLLGWSVFDGRLPPTVALHALTMGVIAFMVLAVSTRVALAHTGRKLQAARLTVVAYWSMLLAVLLRVTSALGNNYMQALDLSAVAWMVAFAIFVWVYWPVLTGPPVGDET
jgi:uncharacterized protein involved in response to NO